MIPYAKLILDESLRKLGRLLQYYAKLFVQLTHCSNQNNFTKVRRSLLTPGQLFTMPKKADDTFKVN